MFSWSREGCSDSQRGAGLCGVSVAGRRLLLSGSARLVGSVGPFHSRLWRPGRAKTSGPAAQVVLAGVSWCLVPEEARALPEGAPPRLYGFLCVPRLLLRSVFLLSDSGGFLSRTCSSGSALGCCSAAPQVPAALASPPSICGASLLGPGCSFLPPTPLSASLWMFVQFSTCLRQEGELESCSSASAGSHSFPAFSRSVS